MKPIYLFTGLLFAVIIATPAEMGAQEAAAREAEAAGVSTESRVMTVEDAVQIALRSNLEIESEMLGLEKRRRTRDTAWNRFIPTISAGTTLLRPNEGQPAFPGGPAQDPQWNLQAEVSAMLNLNLGSIYGIRAARFDYESGLIDVVDARNRIERDVRKTFFALLVLDEQVELRRRALEIAAARLEQTRVNFRNGLVDEFTLLAEEVSYENQRPDLDALVNQQLAARRDFNRELGLPLTTVLDLQGRIEVEPITLNVEQLVTAGLPHATAIARIGEAQRQIENLIQLAKSGGDPQSRGFYPNLTFRYSVSPQFAGDPFGDPLFADVSRDWTDRGVFSITLTQPLDGFLPSSPTRTRIANLETDLADTRVAYTATMRGLELQVRNLVARLEQLQSTIANRERNERLAQRAFELAQQAYAAGTRELLELRNAEQELQTAQLQVLQGKLDYIQALLDLRYILNMTTEELQGVNR